MRNKNGNLTETFRKEFDRVRTKYGQSFGHVLYKYILTCTYYILSALAIYVLLYVHKLT